MRPLWALIPGWILAVGIVIGNGLVIFLITTRPNLRTTTNWFVLSLAVADFGVGAVYYPRLSFCSIRDETCVNEAVKIAFSIGYSFVIASVTNLCALTLDRYLAIVHPLRYATFMTKRHVALLVSAAWGVPFFYLISRLVMFFALASESQNRLYSSISLYLTAVTALACIFLLFAIVWIFLVVRRIARQNAVLVAQLNFNHTLQHGMAFKAPETASAKMIGIVVTVFLVCYLFDTVDSVLLLVGPPLSPTAGEVITLLKLLNSAVNPVAYALHKREIKKELKRLFCRQRDLHSQWTRGRQREAHELRSFNDRVGQQGHMELQNPQAGLTQTLLKIWCMRLK